MTYFHFLGIFLLIPLALLAAFHRAWLSRRLVWTLVALAVLALVYTGPWDNAIIANGVWHYRPSQVTGLLIGRVPLEEYLFYVLQVALTGALTALLIRHFRS